MENQIFTDIKTGRFQKKSTPLSIALLNATTECSASGAGYRWSEQPAQRVLRLIIETRSVSFTEHFRGLGKPKARDDPSFENTESRQRRAGRDQSYGSVGKPEFLIEIEIRKHAWDQ